MEDTNDVGDGSKNHPQKIDLVISDRESVELIASVFRDSFKKKLILALIGGLSFITGLVAVAGAWHIDTQDRKQQHEMQQQNHVIGIVKDKLQRQYAARKNYNLSAITLRNIRDLVVISCKNKLLPTEKLKLVNKRLSARKNVAAAVFDIKVAFQEPYRNQIEKKAKEFIWYDGRIKNLCLPHIPDKSEWKKRQFKASRLIDKAINETRSNLDQLVSGN